MEEGRSQLFDGARRRRIEIELLEETYQQALELIRANRWDVEEGLLIIFANGLAYLTGERRWHEVASRAGAVDEELKRVMEELIHLQSMYSVMKFRAFVLQQDNEALAFQNTGYREENQALVRRLERFRADEERLRMKLRELQGEVEQLRSRLPPGPDEHEGGPARQSRGLLQGLLRHWPLMARLRQTGSKDR